MTGRAEIRVRDQLDTFAADHAEVADGWLTATGAWRTWVGPSDRRQPRYYGAGTLSWPRSQVRAIRWTEGPA